MELWLNKHNNNNNIESSNLLCLALHTFSILSSHHLKGFQRKEAFCIYSIFSEYVYYQLEVLEQNHPLCAKMLTKLLKQHKLQVEMQLELV